MTPIGFVEFISGFVMGTGLVPSQAELDLCRYTIEIHIINTAQSFVRQVMVKTVFSIINSLYAITDIFYYSNVMVVNCASVGTSIEF